MKRKLIFLILLIVGICIFLYANNKWLQTTSYTIQSNRIPKAFDQLKIVQLSDLHDATFGEKQIKLVNKVKNLKPDLIFLTGDLVDSNRYNLENSLDLVEQLVSLADVYYVTGNHEIAVNQVADIETALVTLGVNVLTNKSEIIERNGDKISIVGINDPLMKGLGNTETSIANFIDEAVEIVPENTYKLLLSHRPEAFDMYVKKEIDLVFTGHAHGGQFRLPGIGGLVAPGQGWFPTYTAGSYERGITTMLVNRGLGNSVVPIRILNRPEIVVITLKSTS